MVIHSDTIYLEFDDFKDGEAIEKLLGVDFEEIDELECELNCSITPGAKQTHWQPAEHPECEDLEIVFTIKGQDFWPTETLELSDKLTKASLDRFSEEALESVLDT